MTNQPPNPDEQTPRPANTVAAWFNGPRLILDDRRQPREVTWDPEAHFDSNPDEKSDPDQSPSTLPPHKYARPFSALVGLWAILLTFVVPVGCLVVFAVFAWYLAGTIANRMGLQGVPGRVAVAGIITGVGVFWYLIAEKHKAHRSRRRAAVGERSKRDEHAIRCAVGFNGLCYCCAYQIAPLPREPDRCVVCPECGAAWRVDDWANDGGRYEFPNRASEKPMRSGMLSHSDRITDARDVPVPVLGHFTGSARAREVTRRAGRRFRDALGRKIAILAVVLLAAWPLAYAFGQNRMIGLLVSAFLVPLVVLLALSARSVILSARVRRVGDELVAAGLCPCCESPLRPEPSPIDACHLCDICGSAWNSPDPKSHPRA